MKAVVQERYGSPEVLHLEEIPRPEVADAAVLIRVRAASVNAMDKYIVRGKPFFIRFMVGGLRRPRDRVRGVDVAGVVEAVGTGSGRFHPGDEVFGTAEGSFAEYAKATEEHLALRPRSLTFEQAAALPIAGVTALWGLRENGQLKPGQQVVVYGAGGGVGTYAVQIAKALGARVTAVTSSKHVDRMRALGADEVVDYLKEDLSARTQRYDIFFDVSGTLSLGACRRLLNPGGTLVVVGGGNGRKTGAPIGRIVKAALLKRLARQRIVICNVRVRAQDLEELARLAEAAKVMPVVDRQYPLEQVADAMRTLAEGQVAGKLVIHIA